MITTENTPHFIKNALRWAAQYSPVCYLTGNGVAEHAFPQMLAVGVVSEVKTGALETDKLKTSGLKTSGLKIGALETSENSFETLQKWLDAEQNTWKFGYFSYDLKNELENLSSQHADPIGFPALHFFVPQFLFIFKKETIEIHTKNIAESEAEKLIATLKIAQKEEETPVFTKKINLRPQLPKSAYLDIIAAIKNHIIEGDVYEMNFCQAFFAENAAINPISTFQKLNNRTKSPFAAYYTVEKRHLLCASPERFLQKKGQMLISQPIKGTIKRGNTPDDDELLKKTLQNSEKDRAENVMIVDLVRNDLAKSCEIGSVCVPELCKIYSFAQVHQLISTVEGSLRVEVSAIEALRCAFPMGSMTGAPKIMAMQLIEKYEQTKRGLYSGAVGYIAPSGDFDFNVVIRSLFYNERSQFLSAQVGGAIVYDSDPESEYAECLLKLKAIKEVLSEL
ncbi:MAG: hypothetical protein RI894_1065 [Bacteroidota bacterium]